MRCNCRIRYYLLSVEEQQARWSTEEEPFHPKLSVQLQARKLYFRDGDGNVYEAEDETGMPGPFPILAPGRHTPADQRRSK